MDSSSSNIKVGSFINIKLPDNYFKPIKKRSSSKLKSDVIKDRKSTDHHSNTYKNSNKSSTQIKPNLNQSINQSKEIIDLTEENREWKLNEFADKIKSIYNTELTKLNLKSNKESVDETVEKEICPVMPPFELFMQNKIDKDLRVKKFYRYLREDDYLIGYFVDVNSKSKSDVKKAKFKVASFDGGKKRELDDLNLFVYYLIEDENRIKDDLNEKNEHKYFRFKVDKIIKDQIFVKFNSSLETDFLRLGLVEPEDLPEHLKITRKLRRQENSEPIDFDSLLNSSSHFKNPNSIDYLLSNLQIDNKQNFKRSVDKECSNRILNEELRLGVDYLKREQFRESEMHLNKALILDPANSDVHTAKGCLYANQMNYKQSIREFEIAIKLNDKHLNARKYLIETLSVYCKKLMKDKNYKIALDYFDKALLLDPDNEDAIKSIKFIRDNCLDDLDLRKSKKTKHH